MTITQKETTGKIIFNVLLMLFVALMAWNFVRECERIDRHETRLNTVERALVRIDFIAADITEMKMDIKAIRGAQ